MSKRTKRCPDCGAQMPQNAVQCNRCGYRASSSASDRVDSLPRPIRPEAPKPVETSRWPEKTESEPAAKKAIPALPQNLVQMITIGVLVVAIIVLAIVMIAKMNKPAENPADVSGDLSSQMYLDENGNLIPGTQPPVLEDDNAVAEITPAPTAPPEPSPESSNAPEATTEPTATPAPTEEPEDEPDFKVSETNDTVYITGNGVNLREGPGTDYDRVTSANRGDEFKRTGTTDNGWSRLSYNSKDVYVSNSYVSTDKPDPIASDASGTVVVKKDANLRKGPGTDYEAVKTANANTELERTGTTDNGWTRVKVDGQELYISNSLIETKTSVSERTGTVILTEDANLRKGPGTEYDVITTKAKGTELERTGETANSWVRVKYDGNDAYIHSSLLNLKDDTSSSSASDVEEKSGTVTVLEGANVRKGPGTDYDKLGLAYVGTQLTVTGKSGDWYEVEFDGQKGYIAASLVKEN